MTSSIISAIIENNSEPLEVVVIGDAHDGPHTTTSKGSELFSMIADYNG